MDGMEGFLIGYFLGLLTIPAFLGAMFLLSKFGVIKKEKKDVKQ